MAEVRSRPSPTSFVRPALLVRRARERIASGEKYSLATRFTSAAVIASMRDGALLEFFERQIVGCELADRTDLLERRLSGDELGARTFADEKG